MRYPKGASYWSCLLGEIYDVRYLPIFEWIYLFEPPAFAEMTGIDKVG